MQEYVVGSDFSDSLLQPPRFSDRGSECCPILSRGDGKIVCSYSPGDQSKVTASCIPGDEEEACANLSGSILLGLLFPTRLPSVFTVTQEPLAGVFMGEGSRSQTECHLVHPPPWGVPPSEPGPACTRPTFSGKEQKSPAALQHHARPWNGKRGALKARRAGRGHAVRTGTLGPFSEVLPGSGPEAEG